jgi:hypothetical protein
MRDFAPFLYSNLINSIILKHNSELTIFIMIKGIGDWGLGIGYWGLGIGPNPQSPIPNPQSPIPKILYLSFITYKKLNFTKKLLINILNLFDN